MRHFAAMNKLKKAALLMVAKTMSPDQIHGLKELFRSIDRDNSGTITVEELRVALQDAGKDVTVCLPLNSFLWPDKFVSSSHDSARTNILESPWLLGFDEQEEARHKSLEGWP